MNTRKSFDALEVYMFAGHLKGVAFNIILFKQEINENKTMVSRFKTICQELHEIINEKEVQQRDFEIQYEKKRKEDLAKMRTQSHLLKERNHWKQRFKDEEGRVKRLALKEEQRASIWKKKEFDLLREINILRSEREEFIQMFQTLQASLIAKNIDLDN
ncbi:hypothetical protein MUCCIDRAFT_83073 [Mucor lusitanicus CBS 277.49]|uniref:Uncharacterized protein n=1 Tax=Mucor lusitanicus CBS 277.49 TaxID=747725 RepID=A0A168JKW8_MUCCL|nr:hypothetical protein MUCCIDRAFT_83073 [Mucor lusitanicus CBS 277.49]